MPSIAKKILLGKKYKKQLLSSFQKNKSTQTNGSVFADRIEQVKKTKIELEMLKILDCFLDGHDNYTSNLVSLKTKSLNNFLNSKEICINELVVQMISSSHPSKPKCHKERINQKVRTKRETNTCHTIFKNLLNPGHRHFPTVLFFDVVSTLIIIQQESEKQILNLKFYNVSDFEIEKIQRVRF